jgi:Cu+-exporting ATPase
MSSQTGTAPGTTPDLVRTDDLELSISGMTCASCANRIERKLNKLDGVVATVNYATEKAKVTYPAGMSAAELVGAVEAAGYTRGCRSRSVRPAATAPPGRASSSGRASPTTCGPCATGCCSSPP